ncbi:MAG: prepilin-type N-terminal cleavage/methylation domain-containing protein [Minisyncoccales bacterium]
MSKIKFKKNLYKKFRITNWRLKNGFSLLEVLVAITVITVGLVGVTGLILYNISISRVSPDRIIAVNLAQEGIEVVKNIRDSNWLAGNDFDEGIKGIGNEQACITEGTGGIIQYIIPPPLDVWDCGSDCQVYFKNNEYVHDVTGNLTKFSRLIKLDKVIIAPDHYIKVTSEVGWTDRSGNPHTVTLEDHLYDWK